MRRATILHPLLFALAPVVELYAHNIMKTRIAAALLPALLMLATAVTVYVASRLVAGSRARAALITSLSLLLLTSFGPVSIAVSSWTLFGVQFGRPTVMLSAWIFGFVAGTILILRARGDLAAVNNVAAVIGAGLFVMPVWSIVHFVSTTNNSASTTNCTYADGPEAAPAASNAAPDIWFICLDRYASNRSLDEYFGYDNSDFTDYLSGRGFYLAEDSFSNYVITLQSLAATLNLQYIDCLTGMMGENSVDRRPLFFMLKDYSVWRFLKARGYEFVHAGTRFHVTSRNPNADVNYNVEQMPEFTRMFVEQTAVYPILDRIGVIDDGRIEKYKRVRHNFDRLMELTPSERPRFVFAHFLVPHEPYVLDENGGYVPAGQEAARTREENYIAQLKYTNRRMQDLIDRLLTASSTPPVIIVQADEGPYPPGTKDASFQWESASPDQCRLKTGILNALYLPGVDRSDLYPSLSPVNTFRMVFNHYFGTHYEMLPDECYAYQDLNHLYRFVRITDRLR